MEITQLSTLVYETIGVVGFGLYVLNYTLLTLRYIDGHDVIYFTRNLLGAAFVLIGLVSSFYLSSAQIQIFWVGLSILGIVLRYKRSPHDTPIN